MPQPQNMPGTVDTQAAQRVRAKWTRNLALVLTLAALALLLYAITIVELTG